VTTYVGRCIDQIYENSNRVKIPISKPQTMYITSIMTTQINKCLGWPPPIPLNDERQRIISIVNIGTWGSMAKPYQLILKYSNYKKDTYPYVHVKVFHANSCSSEWRNLKGVHH
jgi:hypothetical protein